MNEQILEYTKYCRHCGKEYPRHEMEWTKDCHGIPFELVCWECYGRLMEGGYAGQYYDQTDESIDEDWL